MSTLVLNIMENIIREIEILLFASECKKVSSLLTLLFSRTHKFGRTFEQLISLSKKLITNRYLKEALFLLSTLKTFSLAQSEVVILTDIKNLISYCYRLKKKLPEAIQECKDSINICKTKPELYYRLPVLHLNLSAIFREDLKNYQKAKIHAELAYSISRRLLREDPENAGNNRNLAVSILTLGQIEENLKNKEAAIIWYSEGIELNNIDTEMINQFKARLYGVSFKGKTPDRRSISSRQGLYLERRKRVQSAVYALPLYDSVNSSLTTSSQLSILNQVKAYKKSERYAECVLKIQTWLRMISARNKYLKHKNFYDYFGLQKKKIAGTIFLVSVYRNAVIQRQKFFRKRLNPSIVIEAVPINESGNRMTICYELSALCQMINKESSEVVLRNNIGMIFENLKIVNDKLYL